MGLGSAGEAVTLDRALEAFADSDSGSFDLLADFCLLYTSDAADERSSVDLGGRRIIKKKNHKNVGDVVLSHG